MIDIPTSTMLMTGNKETNMGKCTLTILPSGYLLLTNKSGNDFITYPIAMDSVLAIARLKDIVKITLIPEKS